MDRGEAALAGAPVRSPLEELGPGQGEDEDRRRRGSTPCRWSTKSSRPESAWWKSSKTMTTGRRGGEALEERPPGAEQLLRPGARSRARAGTAGRARSSVRSVLVGDVLLEHRRDRRAGGRLVVRLLEVGAAADHLAERPERDPLAVGGAPAVVPPDRLDQPVDVLEELPGEPRLADAGRADDADQPRPALAAGGVEQVLELAQLLVAADERRLERLRRGRPRRAGRRRGRARQAGTGRCLALEDLVAGGLEDDRARGGALGRLADEDGRRAGRRSGAGWRC